MATATDLLRKLLDDDSTNLRAAFVQALGLSPAKRYKLGIIRTSLRDKTVLARQAETGINVFAHLEDFRALGELADLDKNDNWITVRYCDLVPGAGKGVIGYVGLVGSTIFLAVHDSAIQGTLPPFPGDPAQVGRNAFTELVLAVALYGCVTDVYVPMRERWWRSELHAQRMLMGLTLNLPGITIWDGLTPLDLSAAGALPNAVKGAASSSSASQNKEAALEKALNDLRDGRWPRASLQLPLGLRRVPLPTGGISRDVELVEAEVLQVRELLRALAAGESYAAIGRLAAELGVRAPGPKGHTRRFADLDADDLSKAAVTMLSERALSYWRTGRWTQRLHTSLPLDTVKGHALEYDPSTRKRYKDTVLDKFPFPDGGYGLDADEWHKVDERRAKEAATRSRRRGAALRREGLTSAFAGTDRWTAPVSAAEGSVEQIEFLFAPETPTAYRLRNRLPEKRGARNREGVAVATLRKKLFDRGAGRSLMTALEALTEPLAQHAAKSNENPFADLDDRLTALQASISATVQAVQRWEDKFEQEPDPAEADRADAKAREHRKKLTELRAEQNAVFADRELAEAALAALPEVSTEVDARLTLPVLVADGLICSDGLVPAEVNHGLHRLGILETLRGEPDDAGDPLSWWTFNAIATVQLEDGSTIAVPFSWRIRSSLDAPGVNSAVVPALIEAWMLGGLADAADAVGFDQEHAGRLLRSAMRRAGISNRGRRSAAIICPIAETRAVIGAHLLGRTKPSGSITAAWAKRVADAYWGEEATDRWGSFWCPEALDETRLVLAHLDAAGPQGMDVDALARRTGLTNSRLRHIIRTYGIAEMVGRRMRAWACTAATCNGLLTHRLPSPETGPAGLICPTCWATQTGVPAPSAYLDSWSAVQGVVAVGPSLVAGDRVKSDDRRLTTSEAADLLQLPDWVIRSLVDAREIPSVRGPGSRGGHRLMREQDLRSIPEEKVDSWRARGQNANRDGRILAAEAAALTGVATHRLRALVKSAGISVEHNAAGLRTYDPDELRAVPEDILQALSEELVGVGQLAAETGHTKHVVRTLTSAGLVPHCTAVTGRVRYNLADAATAMGAVGIPAGDELITIGTAAGLLGVSTGILRTRTNEGVVKVVCVVRSTRWYSRTYVKALAETNPQLRRQITPNIGKA